MLANLSPHLRSSFQAINLLTIAKSKVIEKYGVDTVLKPFMDDLLELEGVSSKSNTFTLQSNLHFFRQASVSMCMEKRKPFGEHYF